MMWDIDRMNPLSATVVLSCFIYSELSPFYGIIRDAPSPVPVSGIWVEHALLTAFLLVASAILFVTRSESSFPVAIKAFHYLDVPWFIVLTLLLAWWQCSVLPRPYFRRRRLFFASST